jgi:Spy/CpxP family protein refolding chaperone
MTHARVARSSSAVAAAAASAAAITPARILGGLLLGGALVFSAAQVVQAASPAAPATAAPAPVAPPTCDDGSCPWHGGEHGRDRQGGHPGHGMMAGPGMGLPFAGPGFERLLDDVKATEAQRKQIREITDKARGDLRALHEKARDQRQDPMAIWTAPKIDAAEAEKQRQQMLAQHDLVSKRMLQAMLDVGQVLTPEQRAKAAEGLKQRREHMRERMQDRKERREEARDGREGEQERLQNHKLRRPAPPASAPAPASQPAPSR